MHPATDRPVFGHPTFDRHESVSFCSDEPTGLKAIIAIHSTALGPALGGTRMWAYDSTDAALRDALQLSRIMTYKNALAGVPFGGAKAVIIADPNRDKSEPLLRAYAGEVCRLGGRFITAEDIGITVADVDLMAEQCPYFAGTSKGKVGDPSPYTAIGVAKGIEAAVAHRLQVHDLHGVRVCVQGLGKVGMRLCALLHNAGAALTVADVRPDLVRRATDRFGARSTDPRRAHAADVDVFAPCALSAILNARSIEEISACIVAGSANAQLDTTDDAERLRQRGILYAPDYVINAGGVLSVAHDRPGFHPDRLRRDVLRIALTLRQIFERAEAEGRPTSVVADQMAEERLAAARNGDAAGAGRPLRNLAASSAS